METPPHRDDYRRLTLINTSNVQSSTLQTNQTPSMLEPIDNEEERNTRRSLVSVQKRTTNQSLFSEASQMIAESQINDHLRICTKLYTENRISTKNAWQLQVIDVMRKIASTDNANALQVAGSSLDIGTKVYGLRVDDVHTKALQLASSMTKRDKNEENDENEESSEPLDRSRKKPKARKRIKKLTADKGNVIDKEGTGMFASINHVECVIFSTRENIQVNAIDNLFTHKLPTNPNTHLLMQLSEERYWSKTNDKILETDDILDCLELPQTNNFNVCLAFNEFEMGNWNPEHEEHSLPDPILDEDDLPIAVLDGSIHDIFEDNSPISEARDQMQEAFQAQIYGEVTHIVDVVPEAERIESDYGYNMLVQTASGKYIDKIWAGPSHWKVKFNKRSSTRFSGCGMPPVKRARKMKIQQKIVFEPCVDDVCETVKKWVSRRTAPTTTFEKTTLPVPECFNNFDRHIDELLLKPNEKRPTLINNSNNKPQQCEMQEYNNNPNDSLYFSHNNIDDEPLQNSIEEVADVPEQMFLGENLVNAPELVSALQVPYAMQAKKMDMKKLKMAIWEQLEDGVQSADFSDVYADIPKLLSSDMKKELTCPLAFVALLHLCNDHNLVLHKKSDSNDFTISKTAEFCKMNI